MVKTDWIYFIELHEMGLVGLSSSCRLLYYAPVPSFSRVAVNSPASERARIFRKCEWAYKGKIKVLSGTWVMWVYLRLVGPYRKTLTIQMGEDISRRSHTLR